MSKKTWYFTWVIWKNNDPNTMGIGRADDLESLDVCRSRFAEYSPPGPYRVHSATAYGQNGEEVNLLEK